MFPGLMSLMFCGRIPGFGFLGCGFFLLSVLNCYSVVLGKHVGKVFDLFIIKALKED